MSYCRIYFIPVVDISLNYLTWEKVFNSDWSDRLKLQQSMSSDFNVIKFIVMYVKAIL